MLRELLSRLLGPRPTRHTCEVCWFEGLPLRQVAPLFDPDDPPAVPAPVPSDPQRRTSRIAYVIGPLLLSGCFDWFHSKAALRPGELAYEVQRSETLSVQLKVTLDYATADPEDGRKALCRRALLMLPCSTVQVVGMPMLKATAEAPRKPEEPPTERTEVSGTVACGGQEECGGKTPLQGKVRTAPGPHE